MSSGTPEAPRKTAQKGHQRHASAQRPIAARRSTKGPLDLGDDPLNISESLRSPSINTGLASPISPPPLSASPSDPRSRSRSPGPPAAKAEAPTASLQVPPSPAPPSLQRQSRSIPIAVLNHLLRPSLFHPLPAPAVQYQLPNPTTPIPKLLESGNFRAAALLSARFLAAASQTGPTVPLTPSLSASSGPPTTAEAVFTLWHVRLTCLCLLGLEHMAADESRALVDVVDAPIYRDKVTGESALPWSLRLLAVRLQARAEGDVGRAVVNMYALAREARRRLAAAAHASREAKDNNDDNSGDQDDAEERIGVEEWRARLRDIEIRVAGLLVEMGDLEGASRMLESIRARLENSNSDENTDHTEAADLVAGRLALLYLHIGNIEQARNIIGSAPSSTTITSYLQSIHPLLLAAEGKFEDVVNESSPNTPGDAMQQQNLAVCLMYSGQLERAISLLTQMTSGKADGGAEVAFPTLLFNLATMHELTTDRAKEAKLHLGKRVLGFANEGERRGLAVEASAGDLKL